MRPKIPRFVITLTIIACSVLIICEFLIYYIVLLQCSWPQIPVNNANRGLNPSPLKAMILADPHLLGPFHGHWWDKLRREWQMHRTFQTAMTLFKPEVVFILGDLFDEGQNVDNKWFAKYVARFHQLFQTPPGTRIVSIAGNHDVGFHYRMYPFFLDRFKENFNHTGVSLVTLKDINFVTINSMAMEGDGCELCEEAEEELQSVSDTLNCMNNPSICKAKRKPTTPYSRPVLMQHFPTYRASDESCIVHDSPEIEEYRENWEVLSKESTDQLGKLLNPRLAFGGHSHHFCYLKNRLGIEEYSVASFSWRNKKNPSFLLAKFTPESHAIKVCHMPNENTVYTLYMVGAVLCAYSLKKRICG